jgi:UDP-N-acetylmuramoylalanine--D-glutamate ligase
MDLAGRRILVVGLERTGMATAEFCRARGAQVTVSECRPAAQVAEAAARLEALGVRLELGGHRRETFLEHDLIIPSPGVPLQIEPIAAARIRGIPVWSEIELAWRFLRGRLVAITGSNGKTTTTLLTGHLLRVAGLPTLVGGNVGVPLISLVDQTREDTVTVAEVSSFQLEAIEQFRPDVAVFLNLSPDHLDRHGSLEAYARAKARLFENQRPEDAAVLNRDDPAVVSLAPRIPRIYWFSRREPVTAGTFYEGDELWFSGNGVKARLARRADVPLRGNHNLENALAACCASILAGAAPERLADALRNFPGVEHRLEVVAEIGGVTFINDSKATNVDAALRAIEAVDGPVLVILGGRDKGSDFAPLREILARRARGVFLIGEAAEKIARQLNGRLPLEFAGTLEQAVARAYAAARPGDTVLLAPACASFDQFQNFEHRGRVFKHLVQQLAQSVASREPS